MSLIVGDAQTSVKAPCYNRGLMSLVDRRALVLYLSMSVAIAFVDHRVRREKFREHVVTDYVPSVIAGTSGAPAKYRVLTPYTLDWLWRRSGQPPYVVFLAFEYVFVLASLLMMHRYLRYWYGSVASLGGTAALAALIPLTFTNTWAHPDTFPDLFLFTAGCYAVAARRDAWLFSILLIGMFNRETIGFLAALWGIQRLPEWRSRDTFIRGAAIAAICIAVYVGLRWFRGFEHYEMWMVSQNFEVMRILPPGFDPYTRIAGFFWIVLLAAPVWFALVSARRPGAPRFFGSALATATLFVSVAWLFAAVIETRVFMPVLPLLLPGAVAAFVLPDKPPEL